jgi:hypothetical protein
MKTPSAKFQLQKSYSLCVFFLFSHVGAIFCVYFTELIFWQKLALTIVALTNLILFIKSYALRNGFKAITELGRNSNGTWYLKKNNGSKIEALLDLPIFISNYSIVLNFISAKNLLKTTTAITKNDFKNKDDFRKFKVLLKTMRSSSK